MKIWNERPREIRNLFNPAFCGLVLAHGIEGYKEENNHPMPFSLTLLILPLCLHKRTRDQIKQSKRSFFTKIVQEHPEIRVDLARRAIGLFPYTMEGFAYLMNTNTIHITENGSIDIIKNKIRKLNFGTQDTKDCLNVSRSLGKKLGLINDRVTIYTILGIKP